MRGLPFGAPVDPDDKRKEILWIAISFIVILGCWLAVVLIFGYQPLLSGLTYDELVMVVGLGVLVLCAILYLGAKEREQRHLNRRVVGDLKEAVTRLDERLNQLRRLYSASAELAGALDLDQISQLVTDCLLESIGADSSSLVLVDTRTGEAVYERHAGNGRDDGPAWYEELTDAKTRAGDLAARIEAWNSRRGLICAPLALQNGLAGVLGAWRGDGRAPFGSDDLRLLTTLANMAAKAIESGQLHAELRESYFATVRSLVHSLDARDNYTATHGRRVAELAARIAERLGVPESLVRDIEVFGPLHDVGKIGVRDAILLKAGRLSDRERAMCQEHCLIGERIIGPLRPSREALALVRNHHEAWDGSGYPDRLAGEEIPLLARILQVADCYDALISDRPYQPAIGREEALVHFQVNAGKRYDPDVVQALCDVLGERPESEAEEPATERRPASSLARAGPQPPGRA